MIVLGVVLLLLGYLLGISVLTTIGTILVIVGAVLWLAGSFGHPIGPRAHYW